MAQAPPKILREGQIQAVLNLDIVRLLVVTLCLQGTWSEDLMELCLHANTRIEKQGRETALVKQVQEEKDDGILAPCSRVQEC